MKLIWKICSTEFNHIQAKSHTSKITIYPNPFIDDIIIDGDWVDEKITTIKIFNFLGVLEYTSTISLSENNEIELSFLNRGVYILKLERGDEYNTPHFLYQRSVLIKHKLIFCKVIWAYSWRITFVFGWVYILLLELKKFVTLCKKYD